jgi:hypothetical protein
VRAEVTPVLVSALYLFPGFGILAGLGLVRPRPMSVVAILGLAYVVGLSAVLIGGTWLLVLGIATSAEVMAILGALIGAAGFAVGIRRRRRGLDSDPSLPSPGIAARLRADGWERWLVLGTGVALLVILVLGLLAASHLLLYEWDAWSIWGRKARMLLEFGSIPVDIFTDPSYAFMHPDYPLLVPLMETTWFRFAGFADTRGLHIQFWLLLVAFAWAASWIVGRRARSLVWLPVLALLVVTPGVWNQLVVLYADIPMALFLGLGLLLLGSWLDSSSRSELTLAVLLLAAAANTKNEGLVAAAAALVAALVVVLGSSPGAWRTRIRAAVPVLVAGVGVVATVLPWRLWLAAHDIVGDMPIGNGLDPSYLASRTERVRPTVDALVNAMTDQGTWVGFLPLGIGVVLAGLLTAGYRRLAAFYGLAGVLIFGSLVWAYWISPNDLTWHLNTSVTRVIDGLLVAAGVATLHLASRATGGVGPPLAARRRNGRADVASSPVDTAGRGRPHPSTTGQS